jgi:hypothetical protein
MLTQIKPKLQVGSFQSQAIAQYQSGSINPSRSITPDDEIHLRDYALAAAVISWDECTYGTPEQVTAADITNIALAGDTVWYQIQLHRAIPIDIETFHTHRLQIQQHFCEDAPTAQPQSQQAQPNSKATKQAQQVVGWAGDFTGCQLRLEESGVAEYESGLAHGKLDAASRMHPICTEATCPYSRGYLVGYNEILRSQPQPETAAPPQWSVTWNAKWQWYEVWVGKAHAGRASNHEEAERIAQKYLGAEKLRSAHRELVLAAFAP